MGLPGRGTPASQLPGSLYQDGPLDLAALYQGPSKGRFRTLQGLTARPGNLLWDTSLRGTAVNHKCHGCQMQMPPSVLATEEEGFVRLGRERPSGMQLTACSRHYRARYLRGLQSLSGSGQKTAGLQHVLI